MPPNMTKIIESEECRRCQLPLSECPQTRWTKPLCIVDGVEWDEHVIGLSVLTRTLQAAVIEMLPEEKTCGGDLMMNDELEQCRGYNAAIADMKRRAEGVVKGEGV